MLYENQWSRHRDPSSSLRGYIRSKSSLVPSSFLNPNWVSSMSSSSFMYSLPCKIFRNTFGSSFIKYIFLYWEHFVTCTYYLWKYYEVDCNHSWGIIPLTYILLNSFSICKISSLMHLIYSSGIHCRFILSSLIFLIWLALLLSAVYGLS